METHCASFYSSFDSYSKQKQKVFTSTDPLLRQQPWKTAEVIVPLNSFSEGLDKIPRGGEGRVAPSSASLVIAQWLPIRSSTQTVLQESLSSVSWPLFAEEMLPCSRKPVCKSILIAKPVFHWGLSVCLLSLGSPWPGDHLAYRASKTRAMGCESVPIQMSLCR